MAKKGKNGMINDLATRKTVTEKVSAYNQALHLIKVGYESLAEAQRILENAFVEHYGDFKTIDHHKHQEGQDAIKSISDKIKRKAWKHFIDALGIRKVLSVKRADQLDKQIAEWKDMPEIEIETVFETFNSLLAQSEEFTREAYLEVYDFLMGGRSKKDKYATNKKNARQKLGKKVILTWVLNDGYFSYRIDYRQEQNFLALDKVFHALDGKGIPAGYRSPLVDAINTSNNGYGETEYFKFRACLNRNLHLEFKRPDLVGELNRIAADNRSLGD